MMVKCLMQEDDRKNDTKKVMKACRRSHTRITISNRTISITTRMPIHQPDFVSVIKWTADIPRFMGKERGKISYIQLEGRGWEKGLN